jgi:short-subunit dehydrogenase
MPGLRGTGVAITGASSGIGRAAALAFAREGCRVALAARREEPLEAAARACAARGAPEAWARAVDVADAAQVQAWASEVGKRWQGRCDVLVANAGVGHYGEFLAMLPEHMEQVVQTNLLGVWRTVHAFGPLLEAARGHVIVTGSMAGKVPLPYLSTYCATKSALLGWSRSARPELRRRGVTLTLLEPGMTRTDFGRHALLAQGTKRTGVDEYITSHGQRAEHVGRAAVRAARWKPRELDLTLAGRAGALLAHLAPHLLARSMERLTRPRNR